MVEVGIGIDELDKLNNGLNRLIKKMYSAANICESMGSSLKKAFDVSYISDVEQKMYEFDNSIKENEKSLEKMEEQLKKTADTNGLNQLFKGIENLSEKFNIQDKLEKTVEKGISYASDLEVVQKKIDAVFGQDTAINVWSEKMLDAVGLSELFAKKFAGSMGVMLGPTGIANEKIETMSMSIAQLAGDMSSFYKIESEKAFEKLQSGVFGDTSSLDEFGINMSAENLGAFAISNGISKEYAQMSQAEQIILRYNYLLASTSNIQGDFAKSTSNYSNQIKVLGENWNTFTGKLAKEALPVLSYGINILNNGITSLSNKWSIIQPTLIALISIISAYAAVLAVFNVQKGVSNGLEVISAARSAWSSKATLAQVIATKTATGAQVGLNGALLACPITWFITTIVLIVGAIMSLCTCISKTTGIAQTGFGVFAGAVAVAVAFIMNSILGLVNFFIGIFVTIWNIIASFANLLANIFKSPAKAILNIFVGVFDVIVGIIASVAGLIDTILKTDMSGSIAAFREGMYAAVGEVTGEQEVLIEKINPDDYMLEGFDYEKEFKSAATWGDEKSEQMGDWFSSFDLSGNSPEYNPIAYEPTEYESLCNGSVLTADNTSQIADNTADIRDSVDVSNENLKYLRDIAEREAVNRFTTAQIKVAMTNNNSISSNMDIDGVVNQLVNGVNEAMTQSAEGVNAYGV